MSEWISVKDERLTKDNIPVLFTDGKQVYYGVLCTGMWLKGNIYGDRVPRITHWMPLPQPPKED